MQEILYHKFEILYEQSTLHLTFLFIFFEMEFNPYMIRQATACKQLSTVNNILKETALMCFNFSERIERVLWLLWFYILLLLLNRGLPSTGEILIVGMEWL